MKFIHNCIACDEIFSFDVNSLYAQLLKIKDLRKKRGVRYPLAVALTMIILAKMSGEDEPRGIAGWLQYRAHKICQLLHFPRDTTPHHTTISRILSDAMELEELDRVVGTFFMATQVEQQMATESERKNWMVISLDGKTLRGTIPSGKTQGLHLMAAYLPESGVVLMQLEVDCKENEIKVGPRLLEMIDIEGKVITADALNTQRSFARQIVEAGGDYLFIVKGNQSNTQKALEQLFTEPEMRPGFHAIATDFQTANDTNKAHGRLETRTMTTSAMLNDYLEWPYLKQALCIQRRVVQIKTGEIREETVYGITSLSGEIAAPKDLLYINRAYWGIENGLHYRRDVTFNEDDSRLQSNQAQHCMATLNNLALGLILRSKPKHATVPDERRRYCATPEEAFKLLIRSTPV